MVRLSTILFSRLILVLLIIFFTILWLLIHIFNLLSEVVSTDVSFEFESRSKQPVLFRKWFFAKINLPGHL